MKKITLCRGEVEHNISIENFKIILGKDYSKKYEIMQIIREAFNGSNSEYADNRNLESKILVNDTEINSKKSILFDYSPSFDLNNDIKMGSKSITIKYVESILQDQQLFESMNTINLLFLSLEEEINFQLKGAHISLVDFNSKILLKLLSLFLTLDGEQASMYDLTYEDFILRLLKMTLQIIKNSTYGEIFILLDIPLLTYKLYTFIEEIKGCNLIIITNEYQHEIHLKDIFIYSQISIDFADDNQLYTIFCEENNIVYELKEIHKMLNNYFNHIKDDQTELIRSILE